MSTATFTDTLDGPLTSDQRRELSAAKQSVKKIRSAARVASFNGWSIGIAAAMSAPFALFGMVGLLMTLGLAAISFREFQGRNRLLRFDPAAAKLLGWNQLALLALVVGYCLWMLYAGLAGENSFVAQLEAQPELQAALGSANDIGGLYNGLVAILYGSIMMGAVVFQGLNALYYFSRGKYVQAYVRDTPEWVRDFQSD
jgi:hypothetical protein